jgi:hypothetical protein
MKKYNFVLILLLLSSSFASAQVINDSLTEQVIKNAPYIVEGYHISDSYCNCFTENYYDEVIGFKVREVYRGDNIHVGDTILLLNPHVGNGNKNNGALIDRSDVAPVQFSFVNCEGGVGCGGQFLILNTKPIKDEHYNNQQIFLQYPAGNCSCFLTQDITDTVSKRFAIKVLNRREFKTKQAWYDYLKRFNEIHLPKD